MSEQPEPRTENELNEGDGAAPSPSGGGPATGRHRPRTRRGFLSVAANAMLSAGIGLLGVAANSYYVEGRRRDALSSLVRTLPAERRAGPLTSVPVLGALARMPSPRKAPLVGFPAGAQNSRRVEPPEADAPPPAGERSPRVVRLIDRIPVRIEIPSIDLDAPVVRLSTEVEDGGLVWETAARAVGHHAGSGYPGLIGNCVMSGHISSREEGDIFRRLPWVQPGDAVRVSCTASGPWLYQVTSTTVVEPEDLKAVAPQPYPVLTLITCVPDGVYTHRLVVSCDLLA